MLQTSIPLFCRCRRRINSKWFETFEKLIMLISSHQTSPYGFPNPTGDRFLFWCRNDWFSTQHAWLLDAFVVLSSHQKCRLIELFSAHGHLSMTLQLLYSNSKVWTTFIRHSTQTDIQRLSQRFRYARVNRLIIDRGRSWPMLAANR